MTRHVKRAELQGIDDLRTLVTAWNDIDDPRGPVARIRIRKLNNRTATYKLAGMIPPDGPDEQYVAVRWGGGKYRADCLDRTGLVCTGISFEVEEPDAETLEDFDDIPREIGPGGAAVVPVVETIVPGAPTPELVVALEKQILTLKDELDRLTRLFERALERGSQAPAPAPTSITELTTALGDMDKMRSRDDRGISSDEMFFKAAAFVDQLRGNTTVDDGGNPWLTFARDVWRDAGPEIKEVVTRAMVDKTTTGEGSDPVAGTPEIPQQTVDPAVTFDFVDQMLDAGTEPEQIGKMMLEQISQQPQLRAVAAELIKKPFDEVVQMDPKLRFVDDPKRSQLRNVWQVLRDAEIFTTNDPVRSGGDA